MDDNIKEWITINHQHVPIKEGQSKREVARNFVKNKMSRVERNKDKYDKIESFKKRKATNKFEEPEPKKKEKIHLINDKDNRYIVSRGESDEEAIENYKRKYGDEKEREQYTSNERRESLMKFAQDNKEQIKKWADEYDSEKNRQVFEKAKQGQGLTKEEYFGFLGSNERPGDRITDVTADGEDVIVAKDGEWVRKSRIDDYNKNPSANKDAIVDIEKENELIDKREYEEFKKKSINNFKARKQSNRK